MPIFVHLWMGLSRFSNIVILLLYIFISDSPVAYLYHPAEFPLTPPNIQP